MKGGQINPDGPESINLNNVEKLTIGKDKSWVKMPDLQFRRQDTFLKQFINSKNLMIIDNRFIFPHFDFIYSIMV